MQLEHQSETLRAVSLLSVHGSRYGSYHAQNMRVSYWCGHETTLGFK